MNGTNRGGIAMKTYLVSRPSLFFAVIALVMAGTAPAWAAGSMSVGFTCAGPSGTLGNTTYLSSGGSSATTEVASMNCAMKVGVEARYTRNGQTHYTGMKLLDTTSVSVSPGSVMGANHLVLDGIITRVQKTT